MFKILLIDGPLSGKITMGPIINRNYFIFEEDNKYYKLIYDYTYCYDNNKKAYVYTFTEKVLHSFIESNGKSNEKI